MSRLSDSRDPRGVGILILQHKDFSRRGFSLDLRGGLLGVRVTDRDDLEGGLGAWKYDDESPGDLNGAQLWKKKTREIPMWRFATPCVVAGSDVATPGHGDTCAILPSARIEFGSVRDKTWALDKRLETLLSDRPKISGEDVWPKFPRGYYGISIPANEEEEQQNLFLPIDPRLVAVNRAGDAEMGSLVCDMQPGFSLDPARQARFQSLAWVIKNPYGESRPAIAWNIGRSGCADVRGGFVIDRPFDGTVTERDRIVAEMSHHQGGPLVVGAVNDRHRRGTDGDGHPINAGHLSLKSFFYLNASTDGPLHFDGPWEGVDLVPPRRVPVHFEWTGAEYMWHSYCIGYIPPTQPPPEFPPVETPGHGTPRRTPPRKPPFYPPTPTEGGTFVPAPRFQPWITGQDPSPFNASSMDLAVPSLMGRPQFAQAGAIDFRSWTSPVNTSSLQMDLATPITGRIEAYGKQLGPSWVYTTEPPASRYGGGTANGGFVVLPPEIGMEESSTFSPAGRTLSTTHFVIGPGARLGFGAPDIRDGAVRTGWSAWQARSGDLALDPDGYLEANDFVIAWNAGNGANAQPFFGIETTGQLIWTNGTGKWGVIKHQNTVTRTYVFPDKSGTVAMTSDVGGLTIGNAISGGTANRVLYEDSSNNLAESANLRFDGTNLSLDAGLRFVTDGSYTIGDLDATRPVAAYLSDALYVGDQGGMPAAKVTAIYLGGADAYAHGIQWKIAGANNWSIYKPGSSTDLRLNSGTADHTIFGSSGAVTLNEQGNDADLRVEGDNKTSCLLLDASDDEVAVDGRFSLVALTPAQIAANQDDYNPESTATNRSSFWRISSDAARNITGIANGLDGRVLVLANVGSFGITLQNENAGSAAANRIITGTGADVTVSAGDHSMLIYDNTSQRWRMVV